MNEGARRRRTIAGLIAVSALLPRSGAAQDIEARAQRCAEENLELLLSRCREAYLTARATMSGVGLLVAGGASVPGSVTTLGRRFGGTPRFGVSVRAALARFDLPRVEATDPAAARRTATARSVRGSLALGVLDGLSLAPTLGGILSLDVLATAEIGFLPRDAGFRTDILTWGVGLRLGVLRESFTVPGISLSLARRKIDEFTTGSPPGQPEAFAARVDPTVWSARAVAGKDLLAVGVMAGLGWERYGGDVRLTVSPPADAVSRLVEDSLDSERVLVFGGLSVHRLVLQLSVEGGWASGFDALPGRHADGYQPEDGSLFLSAAARLTL